MPVTRSAARAAAAAAAAGGPSSGAQQKHKAKPKPEEEAAALEQPGSRLYARAAAQREKLAQRAAEITAQECTFKPQLATKSKSKSSKPPSPVPTGAASPAPSQAPANDDGSPTTSPGLVGTTKRFEKLYLDAQSRAAKLESAKKEQALAEAALGKPKITAKAKQLTAAAAAAAAAFMAVEGEQQQEQQEQQPAQAPPKPKPAAPAAPKVATPGQRLYEQAQRQREKQQQRAAEMLKAQCPFSPRLVAKPAGTGAGAGGRAASPAVRAQQQSQQPQQQPQQGTPSFAERQQEYQKKVAERLQERQRAEQEKRDKELRFTPKINAPRATTPRRQAPGETVFDRLGGAAGGARKEEKGAGGVAAGAVEPASPDCTFKPAIPKRSASVAKERRRSLSLGGQEARGLFERLHGEAKLKEEKIQKSETAVAEKELQGCTFAPTIPPKLPIPAAPIAPPPPAPRPTPARGAPSPAPPLDEKSVFARLFVEAKAKQAQQAQQTQPQGPPRSSHLSLGGSSGGSKPGTPRASGGATGGSGGSSIWDRLAQEAQLRKEKEPERQRQKEALEMAACTFAPKVSPPPPQAPTPSKRVSLGGPVLATHAFPPAAASVAPLEGDNKDAAHAMVVDGPLPADDALSPTELATTKSEAESVMAFGAAKIFTPSPQQMGGPGGRPQASNE